MKLCDKKTGIIALFTILLLSVLTATVAAETAFQVEAMTIKIYRDGLAHITQTLSVDELLPEIDLPLLSSSIENLLILDQNQLAGATQISVEYDTIVLTNKHADVWTLSLNNPYNLTVLLPQNSTVVYLNQVPTAIDTTGTELSLSLNPGQWELSYIVPLQQEDPNGDSPWTAIPIEYFIATIAAVVATIIIVILVVLRKRKINVKKILSRNPGLIKEDIAVIEFLAEKVSRHAPHKPLETSQTA